MKPLSCDVELSLLVALFVGNVAQRQNDEHDDDDPHPDAHVDYLVVDSAVGFTCELIGQGMGVISHLLRLLVSVTVFIYGLCGSCGRNSNVCNNSIVWLIECLKRWKCEQRKGSEEEQENERQSNED